MFMKKKIVFFLALFCFAIVSNAQTKTCKVSGDDNASVVMTVSEINSSNQGSSITLAINSDSSKSVNITFTVTYNKGGFGQNGNTTKPYTITVAPYQTTTYTVRVPQNVIHVNSIDISGARCEKVY